jgi:alkylphosphonate utilization operon protein PhnA
MLLLKKQAFELSSSARLVKAADARSVCDAQAIIAAAEAEAALVKDSNGNVLQDGDTVVIIKDLKVKGASSALKKGTKVKNIRLVDDGVHNIDCNIPGFGAMSLKSEFVKKA